MNFQLNKDDKLLFIDVYGELVAETIKTVYIDLEDRQMEKMALQTMEEHPNLQPILHKNFTIATTTRENLQEG